MNADFQDSIRPKIFIRGLSVRICVPLPKGFYILQRETPGSAKGLLKPGNSGMLRLGPGEKELLDKKHRPGELSPWRL